MWTSSPQPWTLRSFKLQTRGVSFSDTVTVNAGLHDRLYQPAACHKLDLGLRCGNKRQQKPRRRIQFNQPTHKQTVWQQHFPQAGRCACTSLCVCFYHVGYVYKGSFSESGERLFLIELNTKWNTPLYAPSWALQSRKRTEKDLVSCEPNSPSTLSAVSLEGDVVFLL